MTKPKLLRGTLLVALCSGAAFGQGAMTCRRVDSPVGAIRVEGLAELLPDIVLDCTGGTPTAAGAALPSFEILGITSVPLANRQVKVKVPVPTTPVLDGPLPPVLYWNDAIMIVDDVLPAKQVVCVPTATADSCVTTIGGTPFNVFQGQQLQENIALFRHVPIDPPGLGKSRRIRITNLRANATKIPKTPLPKVVTLDAQIYDRAGNGVSIANSQFSVPALPGVIATLRTSLDEPVAPGAPAFIATPVSVPQNNPGPAVGFNIKFTEGFPGAFKRRNLATSGGSPNLLFNQADVSTPFNTETGFFNGKFPETNDLNLAGLSDTGTRLKLTITGIPDNVFFYAGVRDSSAGTTDYSATAPKALLSYADENGYGPFQENNSALADGYNIVQPSNGSITFAWEVVSADPERIEEMSFNVRVLAPNGIARLGLAEMVASFGPIFPGVTVQIPATQMPFPAFVDDPLVEPVPVFRIVPTVAGADLTSLSSASYASNVVAPDSIVSGFGSALTATTTSASGPPGTRLGPIAVDIIDFHGIKRSALVYLASPSQVNFVVPTEIVLGQAVVSVTNNGQTVASGALQIAAVAPGLFSATGDGQGLALGASIQGNTNRSLTSVDASGRPIPNPVAIGDNTFLSLYGTGIRGRSSLAGVQLKIGGTPIPITFAGAQPTIVGLDQVNAGPLPASLRGRGDVSVELTVDGKVANLLSIQIGN